MVFDAGEAEMEKSVMACVRGPEALPLKFELVHTKVAASEMSLGVYRVAVSQSVSR